MSKGIGPYHLRRTVRSCTISPVTKLFDHLWHLICLLAALDAAIPSGTVDIFPPKFRPYIIGGFAVASWVKGHRNLFIDPEGNTLPPPDKSPLVKAVNA